MSLKATAVFKPNGQNDLEAPKVFLFGRPNNMSGNVLNLVPLLKHNGIQKVFAPNPAKCLANIAEQCEFRLEVIDSFPFYNGVEADGVVLEKPGEAAIILSADCPTIVVWNRASNPKDRKVGFGHGGRDSLLDRSVFWGHSKSRNYGSVVDYIIAQFEKSEIPNLSVYTTLGISPQFFKHPVNHPQFGKQNRAMIDYVVKKFGQQCVLSAEDGTLDLHALIRAQFIMAGVNPANIRRDRHDTYSEMQGPDNGEYKWHSCRRDIVEKGYDHRGRNAVMVLHSI